MQNLAFVSVFIPAALVLLTAPPSAVAVCCYSSGQRLCGDCTISTPFCGYGACNIFGCNCQGGCRAGTCSRKRSVDEEVNNAESIVRAGDVNEDGVLSVEEEETMLKQGPNAAHRRSVRSLDKNMDGMLSVDEIDN